jgi:hypothetical protein
MIHDALSLSAQKIGSSLTLGLFATKDQCALQTSSKHQLNSRQSKTLR